MQGCGGSADMAAGRRAADDDQGCEAGGAQTAAPGGAWKIFAWCGTTLYMYRAPSFRPTCFLPTFFVQSY